MNEKLTESLEDYLEAIAELIEVNGHAHTKEISEKLGVKMPSVSGALRQLVERGYIVYNTHYPVQLTDAGREIAERVIYRHAILKNFFSKILGLPDTLASDTACRLEHVVDEDTVERFVLFSEAIENRTDSRALQTYLTEATYFLSRSGHEHVCVISTLPDGVSASVELIGRNLVNPENIPLERGMNLVKLGISLDRSYYRIEANGKQFELPAGVAENIWVRRLR